MKILFLDFDGVLNCITSDVDEFLPEQHKHFVKCSYKYGLTPVIANDIINIFNGEFNE